MSTEGSKFNLFQHCHLEPLHHLFIISRLSLIKFSYRWICFWILHSTPLLYVLFLWHCLTFVAIIIKLKLVRKDSSVQFSSVTQSYPTLCNPMDCSTPGFPVYHQLPELAQTHVHWVSDAVQPSHPLSSPSSPALNLSQHQNLFQWVNSSHQVAKVLLRALKYYISHST